MNIEGVKNKKTFSLRSSFFQKKRDVNDVAQPLLLIITVGTK
jgi:hypothetical protein